MDSTMAHFSQEDQRILEEWFRETDAFNRECLSAWFNSGVSPDYALLAPTQTYELLVEYAMHREDVLGSDIVNSLTSPLFYRRHQVHELLEVRR